MKHKPVAANGPSRRAPKPSSVPGKVARTREARQLEAGAPARPASKKGKIVPRLPLYQEPKRSAHPEHNCTACGLCCTYVAIEIDGPTSVKRATELLWYLYHGGVSLYVNEDDWMVQFEARCRYMQPDYRCGIYATRPHICREFSEQECEVNTGDDGQTFYTAEQFMAHLKQTRPRVYALVQKGFAPPEEKGGGKLSAFERRMQAVHARRAAL